MALFDYPELAAIALDLVTEAGREIQFVQLNSTPPNPARPWLTEADPRAAPQATLLAKAVPVEPDSQERLGKAQEQDDFAPKTQKLFIVASSVSLEGYTELIDEGVRYSITKMQELKPGAVILLHFVYAARRTP